MKGKLWVKILFCLVVCIILLFSGLYAAIVAAITGKGSFYVVGAIICTIWIIIIFILGIFKLAKKRMLVISMASFLVVGILSVSAFEFWGNEKNIPVVSEQGVNLYEYAPFVSKTKAAKLKEVATLKIESDLPKIDGATALYPLYSAFVQAVYPKKEYNPNFSEVICSTTVGAYQSLINGEVDIIFAARPSKQQLEEAKNKGVELKLTPIGREAFVFFVNSRNKVKELSKNQIQDIYSGKITNWKEVGGSDDAIRAFQRPENSGSQTMMQKFMEERALMSPLMKPKEGDLVITMGGIINETASYRNYKNAIGYSFLYFATEMVKNNKIRLLKVDGIYPDKNTIKSKEYSLAAEFYAVTAGSKNPKVEEFIKWILSPQGQYLVEKTGYTPIN